MSDYRLIPLTKGRVTKVSPQDYEALNKHKWHVNNFGYALRVPRIKGTDKRRTQLMHRAILNAPRHLKVDHINGDPLDNRRENLRLATNQQNCANQRRVQGKNTSGFKGVSHYKPSGKWRAYITLEGKFVHLGYFTQRAEAARAYDKAAREAFGEYALTNF